MRAKLLDPTEHYPIPIMHRQRFRGSGITLGCTHADCRWVLDRQLILGEDLKELFALFHPHEPTDVRNVGILGHPGAADGLDLPQRSEDAPIPYEPVVIEQPVVTVREPFVEAVEALNDRYPAKKQKTAKAPCHNDRCSLGYNHLGRCDASTTKVSDCPCPATMRYSLRKIYYPECPVHGADS
jgi:hypothetical protein